MGSDRNDRRNQRTECGPHRDIGPRCRVSHVHRTPCGAAISPGGRSRSGRRVRPLPIGERDAKTLAELGRRLLECYTPAENTEEGALEGVEAGAWAARGEVLLDAGGLL